MPRAIKFTGDMYELKDAQKEEEEKRSPLEKYIKKKKIIKKGYKILNEKNNFFQYNI
jgi:hypothetical protein